VLRRTLHLVLLLLIFGFIIGALRGSLPHVPAKAALLVQPVGQIVEQRSGDPLQIAFNEARGERQTETLLWDLTESIRAAAKDSRIPAIVLQLDEFTGAGQPTLEEVAAAMREVKMRGKRGVAHARSSESVKQALRHGIDLIYHASFVDDEALDMLEAAKDRVFVAPGIAILYAMLFEAEAYGITNAMATEMGYQIEWEAAQVSLAKMHKRGIRVLPGGDYGFAMTPHCQNSRDLEFFVKYLGFTPMEAIRSATLYGGQIMMRPDELGLVKDGYLADLLLVDGDPLANLAILRDPKRILAVMKDGVFAKSPEIASQRAWGRAA